MASENLANLPQFEHPEKADVRDDRLCGLAGYLAAGSDYTFDRFHYQKVREKSEAMARLMAALNDAIEAEAERRLSVWIQAHPDRASWKEPPAKQKGLFRSCGDRKAIRAAYEHFGCDSCGTKEKKHVADGLCHRCYYRRQKRRQKAAEALGSRTLKPAATRPAVAGLCR